MKEHHESWLKAHTDRTEEWLNEKLAEGFDIHHLDGNHDNNDPKNLVLIDHSDHMRLHSSLGTFKVSADLRTGVSERNARVKTDKYGRELYFSDKSVPIADHSARLGITLPTAKKWLRAYCEREGLTVPEFSSVSSYDEDEKVEGPHSTPKESFGIKRRVLRNGRVIFFR